MTVDWEYRRNIIAFWSFGLASNLGFLTMLSAASDIMNRELNINETVNPSSTRCEIEVDHRNCKFAPLGEVLLADIFPAFILKLTMPFFMDRIPFGVRHVFICVFQLSAYLTVGFSTNVKISLLGVVFASISDGVGDVSYLSLSSHYPKHMVSALCSGTGSAGLIGSFLYAFLTESNLVGLSPKTAILLMTIGPCFLFASYFILLSHAPTVHRITLSDPKTWLVPRKRQTLSTITPSCGDDLKPATLNYMQHEVLSFRSKLRLVFSLLKYALPLAITFFFEYFAVESLTAFFVFDCAHGFNLSPSSQYRWFAVVYRLGGLIGRSSVNLIQFPFVCLLIVPLIQGLNGVVFLTESLVHYLPHIYIALILLFFIGIVGGSNYCNTFYRIHKEVPSNAREFSLAFVSMADVFGILAAAFVSIPVHNAICSHNKFGH
ncbi:Battenin [Aphelenchoides besseyi]|nr:Battenin [Aphelenchoides besseyi]